MRSVTMPAGQARMGSRMRTACKMAFLGLAVALAGCSGSQGERILMKGVSGWPSHLDKPLASTFCPAWLIEGSGCAGHH